MRIAIVASHPIQYQAPLFREIARTADLDVYFAHRATPDDQARAGFDVVFHWDLDLLSGYSSIFLKNVASDPGGHHFRGCDTPELGARLVSGRYDVVLVLGWHLKCFHQAILASRWAGLPVMVRGDSQLATPRSLWKRAIKSVSYPRLLRTFDAALYVGKRSREYWEHYRFPEQHLFFSPHCVDTQFFLRSATMEQRDELRRRLGVGDNEKLALFAGKLVDFKRPLDLISAVAQATKHGANVSVLIAGAGPLEGDIIELARELKVRCYLLGFCNQSEMPSAYAAADMLVLPSDGRETWGLVVNEAQACGLPVIVSDACGSAADLVDASTGETFPVGDVDRLVLAIRRQVETPSSRQAILDRSNRYGLAAAAEGVILAAEYAVRRRHT